MSIHEESTIAALGPMMGVMNNLVMYDQHVAQNNISSIVPDLAESWSINEDGKSLTFDSASGRPQTLIVGNSGVQEDTEPPEGSFEQTVDGAPASGYSVAAFGFLVNHFTIDAGALSTFPDLAALGAFLVEHGFALDDPGATIRGARGERIERAATRPDPVAVEFADATVRIPSCHYELVRRYPLPSGELFTGFVGCERG